MLGNVAIDSIEIWVPHWEIQGGLDAIDELFDGKRVLKGEFFEYSDDDGESRYIFDRPPVEPSSTRTHHPIKSSHRHSSRYHGIKLTRKKFALGQRVDRQDHYFEGIVLALGSKHLGANYLSGIHKGTWQELLVSISNLSGLQFKSDLLTSRVLSLDIKGDTVLEANNEKTLDISFSPLEKELHKLQRHVIQALLNKKLGRIHSPTPNWGWSSRKRESSPSKSEARKAPYFQIYSKYYQYLNDPVFRELIDFYKIDIESLSKVVRIESRIHHTNVIQEVFGSNQVHDVIRDENDVLYIKRLIKTLHLFFDPTKLPGEMPKPVETKEKLNPKIFLYLRDLEAFAEKHWHAVSSSLTSKRQRTMTARTFWAKESIKEMASIRAESMIDDYNAATGKTRSSSSGQQHAAIRNDYQVAATILADKRATIEEYTQLDISLYNDEELGEEFVERLIRLGCYWLAPKYIETKELLDELTKKLGPNEQPAEPDYKKLDQTETQTKRPRRDKKQLSADQVLLLKQQADLLDIFDDMSE